VSGGQGGQTKKFASLQVYGAKSFGTDCKSAPKEQRRPKRGNPSDIFFELSTSLFESVGLFFNIIIFVREGFKYQNQHCI